MTRRVLWAVVACALMVSACGDKEDSEMLQVRNAMRATARLPRGVVYSVLSERQTIEVRARIQDDLRYKSSVTVDGTRVLDEVVVDDALADRILDPRAFRVLGSSAVASALVTGKWVLDRYGAPSLLPSDTSSVRTGDDVVLDTLTVFRYVDRVMGTSAGVVRFDPDSLSYRPAEDPFPRPDHDAGEVRFDALRPSLPRPGTGGAGLAARVVPGPQHFRKLAVYVRAGRVVRILEEVDVANRLRDLERSFDLGLGTGGTTAERAARALAVLNQARRVTGGEPIRVRTLDVRLVDVGEPVDVALPADATEGRLNALPHRGDREARSG